MFILGVTEFKIHMQHMFEFLEIYRFSIETINSYRVWNLMYFDIRSFFAIVWDGRVQNLPAIDSISDSLDNSIHSTIYDWTINI